MMIADPIKANVMMDQEEAARLVSKYELLALPIVDESGRLEGIITVDDVIDIIDKEATEDMYKMAGLAEEDRVFTPVSRSVKMRLPWTILNLMTATLAASVVGLFEGTPARDHRSGHFYARYRRRRRQWCHSDGHGHYSRHCTG
jgi:magnesium transporter